MLLTAFLLMLINQFMQLIIPKLLGHAYDALVNPDLDSPSKLSQIKHTMILVLSLHGSGVIAGFGRGVLMGTAGERIVARLRNTVYSQILSQEIAFFESHKTGDLVSRLGSDTTVVRQAISSSWAEVSIGLARLVASICLMFSISPRLALVTLGTCLLVFGVCLPFGRVIGRLARDYQEVLGEAQSYPTETIGAMRTVKAFAAEGRELERYRSKIGDPGDGAMGGWWPAASPRTTYSVGFLKTLFSSGFYNFIFGAGFGAMYVSLWYGFTLVDDGQMTLGQLTAFQAYIILIGGSLAHTSRSISQLIEAKGASARLFELLHRHPTITAQPSPDQTHMDQDAEISLRGTVQFQNVSFAYPTRPNIPVLTDFSLSLPTDSTTALVGSSGAGKTTVVSLLQRFYDVTAGSILIDGRDIRTMDLTQMRRRIGYVQQEPQLFGMTIRENVAYGMDQPVTDDQIYDACRRANAYDFISRWPEGLDTMVGERGVKLSGGQKQRIAIARSILVDPRILILDEATSALDAESEHLVQQAIDTASEGRTVLVIAHRLSTIMTADKIVVMDDHSIRDVGTHDELLGRCGTYQNLIKRQSQSMGEYALTTPDIVVEEGTVE